MYQPRTLNYRKSDPVMRWNLPDRVFFACGACHILAHAFIKKYDATGDFTALWLHPKNGHPGNHIVVAHDDWVFDYHGYSKRTEFIRHCMHRARQHWPDWDVEIKAIPQDALISEQKSRQIEGLWLREPKQFLHDALPRAERFLDRFPLSKIHFRLAPQEQRGTHHQITSDTHARQSANARAITIR